MPNSGYVTFDFLPFIHSPWFTIIALMPLVLPMLQKFFKRAEGKENACDDVLHQLARKRVTGMHYEARVQCVRDWHADRFVHMSKEDARDTLMQPWQYLQVFAFMCY